MAVSQNITREPQVCVHVSLYDGSILGTYFGPTAMYIYIYNIYILTYYALGPPAPQRMVNGFFKACHRKATREPRRGAHLDDGLQLLVVELRRWEGQRLDSSDQ